ncbi:unnamed protein product [Coffea canephora]|uniref:DH200=94 genomic scaffold, scaffold_191 n=1 Tax=Coffea canephora TaxID=49390 RepID=A0A068VAR6_COFCA|nr:unnamed protein product [Coffea canephora]
MLLTCHAGSSCCVLGTEHFYLSGSQEWSKAEMCDRAYQNKRKSLCRTNLRLCYIYMLSITWEPLRLSWFSLCL